MPYLSINSRYLQDAALEVDLDNCPSFPLPLVYIFITDKLIHLPTCRSGRHTQLSIKPIHILNMEYTFWFSVFVFFSLFRSLLSHSHIHIKTIYLSPLVRA